MDGHKLRLPEGLDAETAADVLREYARTDDAQIIDQDTLERLQQEVSEAKEAFAAVIAEQSPQSADTLARQDMDALTEPFRDDDGAIDVDTLQQTPETQSGGSKASDAGTGTDGFNPEALSLSERETLQRNRMKHTTFTNRGMDKRAGQIEAEMEALAGVDDIDDIDWEVL